VIARLDAQRQGDINEQTATVARLLVQNAAVENQRYVSLYQEEPFLSVIAAHHLATAQKSLQEAQAAHPNDEFTGTEAKANLARTAEADGKRLRQKLIGRS